MSNNGSQWSAIGRTFDLNEKRRSGRWYIVNLSDLRNLRPGEIDKPFLAGECIQIPGPLPEGCGCLVKGNNKCGAVKNLMRCTNLSSERKL